MRNTSIETIGVVGAGTMGSGIAQVAAQAGLRVVLYDVQPEFVARGVGLIETQLRGRVEKGRLDADEMAATLVRISSTTDLEEMAQADFVIEAAPEDLSLKQEIFATLHRVCRAATILASNTSSLSVTALAGSAGAPGRVVGMHFFNPVPAMALVEVIAGQRSDAAAVDATMDLARRLGKTPVRAKDTPGFIVNRVARPFYGEALRLLGENVAPVAEIDSAVKQLGFRMGPFELMDLIGIDINFAVTQTVYAAFFGDPRYRPHPIQRSMVESGMIGRKAGRGFYLYEGGVQQPNPQLDINEQGVGAIWPLTGDLSGELSQALTAAGAQLPEGDWRAVFIAGRILAQIINEALFALGEGVASSGDIDTAMKLGTNYPQGPCAWGDKLGLPLLLRVLDRLYDYYHEERYRAAPLLRRLVDAGGSALSA